MYHEAQIIPRRFLPRADGGTGKSREDEVRGNRGGRESSPLRAPRESGFRRDYRARARAQEGSLYSDTLATTPARIRVAREPYVNPRAIPRIHPVRVNQRAGKEEESGGGGGKGRFNVPRET